MSSNASDETFRFRLNQFSQNTGLQMEYNRIKPTSHGGDWSVTVVGPDGIKWGSGKARKEEDAKEIAAKEAFDLMCKKYPDRAPLF